MSRPAVRERFHPLQAVRSAMEAERAPGGAEAQQSARVHDLRLGFGASIRALRSPDEYGVPMSHVEVSLTG
jgi:hypothetical protein